VRRCHFHCRYQLSCHYLPCCRCPPRCLCMSASIIPLVKGYEPLPFPLADAELPLPAVLPSAEASLPEPLSELLSEPLSSAELPVAELLSALSSVLVRLETGSAKLLTLLRSSGWAITTEARNKLIRTDLNCMVMV